MYIVLFLTTFFVKRNLTQYSHAWFMVVIGFYIVVLIYICKYLNRNIKSEYEFQQYDYLLIQL